MTEWDSRDSSKPLLIYVTFPFFPMGSPRHVAVAASLNICPGQSKFVA